MPKFHEKFEYIPKKEAKKLLGAIEKQLNNRFDEIRSEKYNPNTKGFDYEIVLKDFFNSYLNGGFDFLVRVGVLDVGLKVKEVLKAKQNEFDVVAIYKNAIPKLVYQRLVPYDSVAFIAETKQTLTLTTLKADLQKFSKLSELEVDKYRLHLFPKIHSAIIEHPFLERPLRMLFYYEAKADGEKVHQLLSGELGRVWDICVILKENVVLLNSTLPLIKSIKNPEHYSQEPNYPLIKAMYFTCMSIEGIFIDSWLIFWNLFRSILGKPETINK
jgi:hypothetical protein